MLNIRGISTIKRQVFFIIGIIFFIIMLVSGVLAATVQNTSAVISTGIVDIELQIYKLDDQGQEVLFEDTDRVYPGEVTSYIPKVFNKGADCYLRMKVSYIDENVDFANYVTGLNSDFTKYGDYYYYNKVFNSQDEVKLFDSIKTPESLTSNTNNRQFDLIVTVEAMQERNFEPDYNADEPWQGITPTENESYDTIVDNDYSVSFRYVNTEKDVSPQNNFWEGLEKALPGDSISNSIMISNNNKEKTKYYLEITYPNNGEEEIELLKQIDFLIINKNGKVVYAGKLYGEDKILVADIEPKQTDEFNFRLIVPEELTNEYANLNPKLVLGFSNDYVEHSSNSQPVGGGGTTIGEGESTASVPKAKTKLGKTIRTALLPRTGDYIDITLLIFIISSIGLITTIVLDYRERKK